MNIYLEPSGYRLLNVGDAAMQIAAIERLRDFWSLAHISATTEDAKRLAYFCPSVAAVSALSRRRFFSENVFGKRLHEILPGVLSEKIINLSPVLRRRYPNLINSIGNRRQSSNTAGADFWTTLKTSNLVVISGAGNLNDEFETHARTILETIDLAVNLKIPVVMLGQGIGPIKSPQLAEKASRVLPKVDLIAVRESRRSIEILQNFNVAPQKILVTGDDAVETVYKARKNETGKFIGLNFRVAGYSKVETSETLAVAEHLRKIAEKYQTELLPVPISFQAGNRSDLAVLQSLDAVKKVDYESDDNKTPAFVIEQISRCRLVVTGSYHAAVFALAQGIPVVCTAKTEYYLDKFYGLAEQFKTGCRIVSFENAFDLDELTGAVENAWREAIYIKDYLLEQSRRQIKDNLAAYRQIPELFNAGSLPGKRRHLSVAEQH